MGNEWREEYLDATLVPSAILLLVAYHVRLAYRVWKAPTSTTIGLNHVAVQAWVHTTMKGGYKNGVFIVQTMRNSIMSSSLLAAAAITMSSMIGVVLSNDKKSSMMKGHVGLMLGERGLRVGPPIKLASLLPCFLVASLCYVRSATFYSNASFLLSLPFAETLPTLAKEHFKKSLVWASVFRSIGARAFFFSLPLFFWLYGPIPMFCTSLLTIAFLYSQDTPHMKHSMNSFDSSDVAFHHQSDASPLMIGFGPFPADSACQFCPHN